MRNNNFIILPGWAVNELELKPAQLIVFGYIYGYTQNGEQWYDGSYSRIADALKSLSRDTVIRSVKLLVEKKYIEKQTGKSGNKYRVNYNGINEILTQNNSKNLPIFTSSKMLPPDQLGSSKMLPPVVAKCNSDHISNILSNILGILPKDFYKNLPVNEKRFVDILTDEIWIDANLKRMLLNENLYKDFDKEVLPVLANFIKNKIGAGDVEGNQGRIRSGAVGYLRAVLKSKIDAKRNADDSEPKYEII